MAYEYTPLLDPDLLKIPSTLPSGSASKFERGKTADNAPQFALPDRVGLGSHVLRLDTSRKQTDFTPRLGGDGTQSGPLTGLTNKKSTPLPNYFGLTLSTPLN